MPRTASSPGPAAPHDRPRNGHPAQSAPTATAKGPRSLAPQESAQPPAPPAGLPRSLRSDSRNHPDSAVLALGLAGVPRSVEVPRLGPRGYQLRFALILWPLIDLGQE